MPIDYKNYPMNWKTEIRPAILERANNCCEVCGVENYAVGLRSFEGKWYYEKQIDNMNSSDGEYLFGGYRPSIKIVLTIAHLDHDIKNNSYDNLKAMCQKCHLNYDKVHHATNSRNTRNKKKKQLPLF